MLSFFCKNSRLLPPPSFCFLLLLFAAVTSKQENRKMKGGNRLQEIGDRNKNKNSKYQFYSGQADLSFEISVQRNIKVDPLKFHSIFRIFLKSRFFENLVRLAKVRYNSEGTLVEGLTKSVLFRSSKSLDKKIIVTIFQPPCLRHSTNYQKKKVSKKKYFH